jgi:hypothetical protein
MSHIVSDAPEIAFHREGLWFETSGDLGIVLKRIDQGGGVRDGIVVVQLNVDKEGQDHVLVDEHRDSITQLEAAISAMQEARDALRRLR